MNVLKNKSMKVRMSNINETDDKVVRGKKHNLAQGNDSSGGDEEEVVIKQMVRLKDFDITISLWGIECIEKIRRFVPNPTPRWQYGIVINGGMEPSQRYPKTDIEAWYENEAYRDERYEYLLCRLEDLRFKVIEI